MARISEDRVDLLEEKMRAKIDTMTGFSDVEAKSRSLEKVSSHRMLRMMQYSITCTSYLQHEE